MVQQYNHYKVLLVGASGMLGSKYFSKSSKLFDVIGTSSSNNYFQKLDITNSDSCEKLIKHFKPDIIVNCSAYTDVDSAEINRAATHNLNVKGMKNLIKHSNKNTKIVHVSTDYIFDGSEKEYFESSLPCPLNYYGKTKLEAENLLRSSNRKFLIFRINCLFDFDSKCFYSWVIENLKNGSMINVVDDQISNPTFTDSLVDVINECIILESEGIFNYGTKDSISRYDFARLIARRNSLNEDLINQIKTADLKQTAKRPMNSYLNCSKIVEFLNIDLPTISSILEIEVYE